MTLLCFIPLRLPSFLKTNETNLIKEMVQYILRAFIGHRSSVFRPIKKGIWVRCILPDYN
jgi:hypothetical protein